MLIIDEEHHSVVSAPLVKDICYPFFQDTGVSDFVYARIFDNNEIYSLNSNRDWQLLHCNEGHLVTPPMPHGVIANNRCVFMLTLQTAPDPFIKTIKAFQTILAMDYPFFILERHHFFYDLFVFCTKIGNQEILNFYLTQQTYLEKFKHFFLDKGKNLIKDAQKNKFSVPNSLRPNIHWENENKKNYAIAPNCYMIFNNGKDIIFTAQEANCLKHLSLGYDTKTTAKLMGISPRTVEFHIRNIKDKAGLSTLSSTMAFLRKLDIPIQSW